MRSERGSATIVVLTLMIILTTLVIVNSVTLAELRVELRRLDRQQQMKFTAPPP
jgi:Na+-transporting NADH:ubiquinone oxidoreductase subunit NqrC